MNAEKKTYQERYLIPLNCKKTGNGKIQWYAE